MKAPGLVGTERQQRSRRPPAGVTFIGTKGVTTPVAIRVPSGRAHHRMGQGWS